MVNTILRSAFLLLLASAVTACGFHLRGNIPLPEGITNMHVIVPKGSFKEELEEALVRAGATLFPSEDGADVILNVKTVDLERKVGTLDSFGKANSYTLIFRVAYVLTDLDKKPLREVTYIKEIRQYDFDPELVVESESEEAELLEDMEQSASLKLMRQLTTITNFVPQ